VNPDTYNQLLTTQQGEALSGATLVPFLGSNNNTPPKPNPVPYTQRGGSILAISGLLLLGGVIARSKNIDMPSQMLLGSSLILGGYGVARLT
jgi:hypothetical protein